MVTMNKLKLALFGIIILTGFSIQGCDKCDDTSTLPLAPGEQGFTVRYDDSSGVNVLDAGYKQCNVSIGCLCSFVGSIKRFIKNLRSRG